MANDNEMIERIYRDYFEAFQTLDPRAVAPYFHLPCMLVSATGVQTMTTAAEVETMFARMMQRLKTRGYVRSDLAELRVQRLSDGIARVRIHGARYQTGNVELERLGATYQFRKTDAGWKIVTLTMHDPDIIDG